MIHRNLAAAPDDFCVALLPACNSQIEGNGSDSRWQHKWPAGIGAGGHTQITILILPAFEAHPIE